jgi:para-nitrobenzyl esterase
MAGGNSWEASLFPQAREHPEPVLARLGPARARIGAAFGDTDPAKLAMDLTTATTVIEPDRELARLHARNGQKAWTYYFSYVPAAERASVPGAGHGSEIIYVFNNLFDQPLHRGSRTIPAATPEDHRISDAMTAYWVAFARSSDPDSAGGPAWLPAEPGDKVMEFGADGVHLRPDFHKPALDAAEAIARAQAAAGTRAARR